MIAKSRLYRAASLLILAGLAMLCQPFAFGAYVWGFPVLLAGVVLFLVLDHTPGWGEED